MRNGIAWSVSHRRQCKASDITDQLLLEAFNSARTAGAWDNPRRHVGAFEYEIAHWLGFPPKVVHAKLLSATRRGVLVNEGFCMDGPYTIPQVFECECCELGVCKKKLPGIGYVCHGCIGHWGEAYGSCR